MNQLKPFKPRPHTYDDDFITESPDVNSKRINKSNIPLQQSPCVNTCESKLQEFNPLDTEVTSKSISKTMQYN